MRLVYVHIGNKIPDYAWDTIAANNKFGETVLVTDANIRGAPCITIPIGCLPVGENRRRLNSLDTLRKIPPENYWHVTCERLFVLEDYIATYGAGVCHLENDVLIYRRPEMMFGDVPADKVAYPIIGDHHGSGGIMYAPSLDALRKVNARIVEMVEAGEAGMAKYWLLALNEMEFLRNARNNLECVYQLPTVPTDSETFVFDPATYGQYLGGPCGKEYEFDVFHRISFAIRDEGMEVWFDKEKGPFVRHEGRVVPIVNLHVHSKNIKRFVI